MDLNKVLAQLREELENLDTAILSLERLQNNEGHRRRGRPPKALSNLSRAARAVKEEPEPEEPLPQG
jgi:uncharacterized membrane protein YccC